MGNLTLKYLRLSRFVIGFVTGVVLKDTNTFINKVQFHYIGLKCCIFLAIRVLYVDQPSDIGLTVDLSIE